MLMTFLFSFLLTLFTWMAGVWLTMWLKNHEESQSAPVLVQVKRETDVF